MRLLIWLFLPLALWGLIVAACDLTVTHKVFAEPLMCGSPVAQRTQLVRGADPTTFVGWNRLFQSVYGFPILAVGEPADVVVEATADRTWVDGCATPAIVHLNAKDAAWLPHELGHALRLPDYCNTCTTAQGYFNPQPVGNYIGVMSYETSPQSWFSEVPAPFVGDADLVRGYW